MPGRPPPPGSMGPRKPVVKTPPRRTKTTPTKPTTPEAKVWAAPRSIFVPDALVPKPKPKPKPTAPYKSLPKADHKALVQAGIQQAQERRAISLGALKVKDAKQPLSPQITDIVPTGEDVDRARLEKFKQEHGGFDIGNLVKKGLSAVYGAHVFPTIDLHLDEGGLAQRPDLGLASAREGSAAVRFGMGEEMKGAAWLGEVFGKGAGRAAEGLAATGYLAGQIGYDILHGQGLSSPEAQKSGYDMASMSAVAHGLGQFTENLVGGGATGFLGFGPSLVEMALAPTEFAQNMKQQYRDAYIDLIRGDEAAFWEKFKKTPSQYLFDMFAVLSAAGKLGSMAGMIKDPGRVAWHEFDGGRIQRYTSPNLVSRLIENRYARLQEKHPDIPIVGAKARMKANMRLWRERGLDREMGDLAELQVASKWFRGKGPVARSRNTAFDVFAHYGPRAKESIHDEIAFFKGQLELARTDPPSRSRALLIRRLNHQVKSLEDAIPLVEAPPPELTRAVDLARTASTEATTTRVEAGILSPQAAANAPSARLRMVTPAQEIASSPVREMLISQIRESLPPELVDAAIKLHDAQVQAIARIQGRSPSDVYNERWGGIIDDPRFLMDNPPPVGGKLYQRKQETRDPEIQKYYLNAARRLVRAHKGALPETHQTVARVQKLLLKLRDRAIEAEMARFWYETSAHAIMRHAGGNPAEATLIAKLIAIYSPRAEVWDRTNWNNTTRALGAYDEFKNTGTISDKWSLSKNPEGPDQALYGDTKANQKKGIAGQPIPDWQTENAVRTMRGEGDWEGLKTNSFYSNFLKWIDPAAHAREFGAGHVTIDTWMRRAFEYLKGNKEQVAEQLAGREPTRKLRKDGTPAPLGETITDPMYSFMREAVNDIASELGNTVRMKVGSKDAQQMKYELGWEPEATQAAIWTSIKGEIEGTPVSTAGIDFGYALDTERTRQLARQRIDEHMRGVEEAPSQFPVEEPSAVDMYDTFIADQAREIFGGASVAQRKKTEYGMKYLDPDNPVRMMYEKLVDQLSEQGLRPDGTGEVSAVTPDPSHFFQVAEVPLPTHDIRVIPAAEAATMEPRPGYVYHGSDNIEQIVRDRMISAMPDQRMPWEHAHDQPPMAWLTADPKYAATYGKDVIEIPASALPRGTQETRVGPRSFYTPEDVLFQAEGKFGFALGDEVHGAPGTNRQGRRGHVVDFSEEDGKVGVQFYPQDSSVEYHFPEDLVGSTTNRPDLRIVPEESFWYDSGFDETYQPIEIGPRPVQLSTREMIDLQQAVRNHPQVPGLKDVVDAALEGESPTSVGRRLEDRIEWAVTDPDTPIPAADLVDLVAFAEKLGAKPYTGARGTDIKGFHDAAAQAMHDSEALARDIASMFPPDQWRAVAGGDPWVRNSLEKQGLLDENGNYIGIVPDTIPEDWLAQMGPDLDAAIEATLEPEGGFSLLPNLENDPSTKGYLISRPEYEGRFPAGQMTAQDVAAFAAQHQKELALEGSRVGGWHNPRDGQVYLDISDVHNVSREEAIRIGREQGQLDVFDREAALERGDWDNAFIPTGLTPAEADLIKMRAKMRILQQKKRRSPFDKGKINSDPMQRVRGMVMFDEEGKAYQWLNPEISGLSTVRHEDIHAMRRQLERDAEVGRPRAREILDKLEAMVGVKNGVWKRKHEEALAKLFEDELHTGTTAQPSLREAYDLARDELTGMRYSKLWKQMSDSQRALLRELVDPNTSLFSEGAFYVKDTMGSPAMRALKSLPRGIRKPKKRNKRNLGILFSSGRIRRSPRVVLEDAAEAKRMKIQLTTVDDIVQQFGLPLEPELRQGLRDGYVIMNPEGVKIPRSFLQEVLDDPEIHPRAVADAIMNDEREMLDNIFINEERLGTLPSAMRGKVVQVPEWVKDELMYGNLKLNAGGDSMLNMLGGLFDSYNNVNRLAGIYLKPAYTTVNFTSNALFAALKQGVFFPINLAQAAGVLGDLPKSVLRMLDEEVGSGGSIAISGEGKGALGTVTDAVAHAQNFLADRLLRRTAIIHELRKEGVIDIFGRGDNAAKIVDFIRNPKNRERLNVVGMDAENSMVRFRGLSNVEKQVVSRAIYVYPWIKGATRYAIRMPWDMPVRASVVSHMGQEGWDWVERNLGTIASFMRSKSPVGPISKEGFVRVVDPNSLTAQSSAGDVLGAVLKAVEGAKGAPDFSRTVSSLFTPSLGLLTGQATGTTDIGRETGNILEAFGADVPNVGFGSFVSQMILGQKKSKYYKGGGRLEVLGRFFFGALYPRNLNVEEARKAGLKQMKTVDRWVENMKAGKAGYTPVDVQIKILRKQGDEIKKLDEPAALTYKLATEFITASQVPEMAGVVDASKDGINAEIKGVNELRAEAKLPPIPELTDETYAQYVQAVKDAQEVTSGG